MSDSTAPQPAAGTPGVERTSIGGPLAVTAVTLGLLTWPIGFNLGAYGEVFYEDVFRVVVASTILFVITVLRAPYEGPWIWVVRAALAAPMLWLLSAAWVEGSTSAALDRPGFALWLLAILLVSVPVTLRLLIDLFMPELAAAPSRRLLWSIVSLVAVVGVVGFVVGRENDRFLTCSDFTVAGSAEPENCARSEG